MKLGAKDLKRLGLPIATCLVLCLGGLGGYVSAERHLQDTKKQRAAILAQRTEVQSRLDRANEEEREIRANLQQYRALEARGITGQEDRMDWIDTLTAIKNERRLLHVSYSIAPQKPLDYPGVGAGAGAGDGVYFLTSRVIVDLQLLHVDDLLNFIDDLSKRSKMYLSTRSCNIGRSSGASGGTTLAPRLQANCVFDLITIRHSKPA